VTAAYALIAFRARAVGSENVPSGPVILAPNHASFMDHFFCGAFVRRRIQFMAKSQLFAPGIPSYVFSHGGVFPVRRGVADEEGFTTAYAVLDRGGALGMYCEGGRSRNGELAEHARPGIGRLALESGAPVVPVAILGSHQVRNWKRLQFPKVIVRYGVPFRFGAERAPSRERQQHAADAILDRIRELHAELLHAGGRRALRAARRQAPAT
jgi:1-acyl-sn-glycerol-3-phosphate acyltransferase